MILISVLYNSSFCCGILPNSMINGCLLHMHIYIVLQIQHHIVISLLQNLFQPNLSIDTNCLNLPLELTTSSSSTHEFKYSLLFQMMIWKRKMMNPSKKATLKYRGQLQYIRGRSQATSLHFWRPDWQQWQQRPQPKIAALMPHQLVNNQMSVAFSQH